MNFFLKKVKQPLLFRIVYHVFKFIDTRILKNTDYYWNDKIQLAPALFLYAHRTNGIYGILIDFFIDYKQAKDKLAYWRSIKDDEYILLDITTEHDAMKKLLKFKLYPWLLKSKIK